jgi:hypothetical protein
MLRIPKNVQIQLLDEEQRAFMKSNVIVGIKFSANLKNDIELFPFSSDSSGLINITEADIREKYNSVIDSGLMDYASLETAQSEIKIGLWATSAIDKYIERLKKNKISREKGLIHFKHLNLGETFKRLEVKEGAELILLSNNFNKNLITEFTKSIIDNWEKEEQCYEYHMIVRQSPYFNEK